MEPFVTAGYLGWSNVRSGLEFYVAGRGNARWEPRRRSAGHGPVEAKGLLLQDELENRGYEEGTSVVVLALPGRLPEKLAMFVAAELAVRAEELIGRAEELAIAVGDDDGPPA